MRTAEDLTRQQLSGDCGTLRCCGLRMEKHGSGTARQLSVARARSETEVLTG